MEQVVEINADGIIQLPTEIMTRIKPPARFVIEEEAGEFVLRLEKNKQPFWVTATPEERAADLRQWALSHKNGPNLPDEALRRENMYE